MPCPVAVFVLALVAGADPTSSGPAAHPGPAVPAQAAHPQGPSSPEGGPSAAIAGTVRRTDGSPVEGVTVCAFPDPVAEDLKEPSASARTDGAGAYRLALPAGTYMVSASAPGRSGAIQRGVVPPSSGGAATVDLVLPGAGRSFSGTVTTPAGDPAAGAWVFGAEITGGAFAIFAVRSAGDGSFVLSVPDGRYVLGAAAGELESAPAYVTDTGDTRRDLRLQAAAKGPVPAEVKAWLGKHAVPLASASAGSGLDDMAPLEAVVGKARVVALGEATHGTREFFQLKHRMLELLVRRMGFTVFAIEASLPDALAVDTYVLHGTGDPAEALAGLGFWTWNTQEVLEMIRWMRRYNDEPTTVRKVRFVGFDMQAPAATADRLAAYLKKVDPSGEGAKLLDPLAPLLAPAERGSTPSEPDRAKVRSAIAALDARLADRKAAYVAASSATEHALAVRLVELLRQAEAVQWGASFVERDRAMADNVRWILGQEPPGTRMVLWAHNGHVTFDDQAMGGGSMGVHLRRALGRDYLVVGFAFDRGSFQAVERGKGLHAMSVGPAKEESLDAALAASGPELFALDLRRVPERGPVADWFRIARPARSIGAVFDPAREQGYYVAQSPVGAYDALLFVRSTTTAVPTGVAPPAPRRPGPPLPPPPDAAANLDFEAEPLVSAPGWLSPTAGKGYSVASDETAPAEGKRSARLERDGAPGAPFGNLMQRVSAVPYRGKKVRFAASVRSEVSGPGNQAQLWLRVDRADRRMGFFDNMQDRPIVKADWSRYEIVGDVAEDAESLNFGLILVGDGRAWIDAATLEVVD